METLAERIDDAWEWWSAAIDEAQEGRWARSAVERQVVKDMEAATNPLCYGRGPDSYGQLADDPWPIRIGRIANWAGVLRLAAGVGGWELQSVAGRRPPQPARMGVLLSSMYAVAEMGELWMRGLREGTEPTQGEIREAEGFFIGPGTMEDLDLFFYDN